MKCANCGAENANDLRFCENCGTPLRSTASTSPLGRIPGPNDLVIGKILIPQNTIILAFVFVVVFCVALSSVPDLARAFGKEVGLVYANANALRPIDSITLLQIQSCCQKMSESQRSQYLESLVGKRINWQGTISSIDHNGTVNLSISDTFVEMKGVPQSVAAGLQPGQQVDFVASITKAEQAIVKPGVELVFESLQ